MLGRKEGLREKGRVGGEGEETGERGGEEVGVQNKINEKTQWNHYINFRVILKQ